MQTDYNDKKSENRKSENFEKNRKNCKVEHFQNLVQSIGANVRPKGEPVAVGDLKASS